jgi:hypothetical protein
MVLIGDSAGQDFGSRTMPQRRHFAKGRNGAGDRSRKEA